MRDSLKSSDRNKKEPNGSSSQDGLGVAVEGCGQERIFLPVVTHIVPDTMPDGILIFSC